jgi:hypothetical protein
VLGVSGLSVEQRKRLTIAVELVANPSIVFMGGRRRGSAAPRACWGGLPAPPRSPPRPRPQRAPAPHPAPPPADEPTTGLDARAASLVMSTVRATVNTGRTVGEPWEGPRPLPPCFRHRCAAGPRHAC